MNQLQERLTFLIEKFRNSACTPPESSELMELLRQPELESVFQELIEQDIKEVDAGHVRINKELPADKAALLLDKILAIPEVPAKESTPRIGWWKWTAAAILLVAVAGVWRITTRKTPQGNQILSGQPVLIRDIQPGSDGAQLILADGTTILLDSVANGALTNQGATKLVKRSNGQLVYLANGVHGEILFNTLVTARGRQFHITLPDGTDVWLNAASSLRYPAVFAGKERKVEVTGEAYFEVAKDKSRPFIVVVDDREEVEVLGTHFNINAYRDEALIRTSLLEGSVQIMAKNKKSRLIPGQQAQVNSEGLLATILQVDPGEVTAWKNGYFHFVKADIKTVMRQLARWYDIDVEYQGTMTGELFGGKLERSLTLSQVLKVLERMGLHYQLKGKQLIVTGEE